MVSFGQQHLSFLVVGERWRLALIFDEYSVACSILEQGSFEGMEDMIHALSMSLLERKLSNQSLKGRVAILLGDVKKVVWEEQISELQSFDAFLPVLLNHPNSSKPEWLKTLTEPHNFLKVPPILPNLEDLQNSSSLFGPSGRKRGRTETKQCTAIPCRLGMRQSVERWGDKLRRFISTVTWWNQVPRTCYTTNRKITTVNSWRHQGTGSSNMPPSSKKVSVEQKFGPCGMFAP